MARSRVATIAAVPWPRCVETTRAPHTVCTLERSLTHSDGGRQLMADYTIKRIDEMEGAYGGAFKRVRAELGVTSFGMAIIDMPANFEHYPTHDHARDGQEEVFLTLRGDGEIDIAGERH